MVWRKVESKKKFRKILQWFFPEKLHVWELSIFSQTHTHTHLYLYTGHATYTLGGSTNTHNTTQHDSDVAAGVGQYRIFNVAHNKGCFSERQPAKARSAFSECVGVSWSKVQINMAINKMENICFWGLLFRIVGGIYKICSP